MSSTLTVVPETVEIEEDDLHTETRPRRGPQVVVHRRLEDADAETGERDTTAYAPNVQYLGLGYDVVKLDARSFARTPGRKDVPVFQFELTEDGTYNAGPFRVPKGTIYAPGGTTLYDTGSESFLSAWDYQSRFSQNVKAKVGVPLVAMFSASSTYQETQEQTSAQASMFTHAEAVNERFTLTLDLVTDPAELKLSSQFTDAVRRLPTEPGPAFQDFVGRFGTHVSSRVVFGGRAYQATEIELQAYAQLVSQGVNVTTQAQVTFDDLKAGGGSGTTSEDQKRFLEATKDSRTEMEYSGGIANSDVNQWLATVPGDPAPVKLGLELLSDLLVPRWIDGDAGLERKRELLEQAILEYIQREGLVSWVAIRYATAFDLAWKDRHSGGDHDGAFYQATGIPSGYHALGGYGQRNYDTPRGNLMLVHDTGVAAGDKPLFVAPRGYELLWADHGTGKDVMDGSFYRPIPPAGYVSLGDVAVTGYDTPPEPGSAVCVRQDLVVRGKIGDKIWDADGTGADEHVSMYYVVPADDQGLDAGTYWVRPGHNSRPSDPPTVWVLKKEVLAGELPAQV